MGRASREKGKRGEREVVAVFRDAGLEARRTAPMQAQEGAPEADVAVNVAGQHIEVKRVNRIRMLEWSRQAERAAGPGIVPAVAYRPDGEPWRVSLPLEDYAQLLKRALL